MPTIEQYKGEPILCLNPDDRFKLSFGLKKAKMILHYLDVIRAFVASEGKSIGTNHDDLVETPQGLDHIRRDIF